MLDINKLRNELPKIGDVLIKIPITASFAPEKKSYPCVVTYINTEYLWYQVEFNFAGVKFKQNYNLIDDDYNEEMHEYWSAFNPGSIEQLKLRRKNIENADKVYDGTSSIPKRIIRDPLFKDIFEITKELDEYNKKHNTNLSYGQYINLFYRLRYKRRYKNGRNS